jgi:Tol biopolymer transport system component
VALEQWSYVSRHPGQWGSRSNPPSKIYEYQLVGDEWQLRGLAPFSKANTDDSDGDVFISPDGQYVFFTSGRTYPGKADTNPDIWRVPHTGDTWGKPQPITVVNSPGYEASPVTDAAGNLYFSSMREGGIGQGDLYIARLIDGNYHAPELLPSPVNSTDGEWNLLVDPAGQWLIYEASSQERGLSPYGDLYLSRKEGNTWGTPEPLKVLNTTGSDLNPRLLAETKELLFISSRFLRGTDTDVYTISLEKIGL